MAQLFQSSIFLSILCLATLIQVLSALPQESLNIPTSDLRNSGEEDVAPLKQPRVRRDKPTAEHIKAVLDKHNEYRRQEGAANMIELVWSECLADMASEYLADCKYVHGQPSRDVPNRVQDQLGQNIYATSDTNSGSKAVVDSVELFYNEKKDFNNITRACRAVCGHYTQVVWAKSQYLGCAFKQCDKYVDARGEVKSGTLAICNYYPAGNFGAKNANNEHIVDPPYESGEACSNCPKGSKCNSGLCSVPAETKYTQGCPGSGAGEVKADQTIIGLVLFMMGVISLM